MEFKFKVNEEVYAYDILGKKHKGIIQRAYKSTYDQNLYKVLLTDTMFIVDLDEVRIEKM